MKHLGVVPNASNSYLGGLDFSESMLFPDGTAEIRITVDYKIEALKLLPIDAELHFTQSAVTRGWPCGTNDFQPTVVKSGTGADGAAGITETSDKSSGFVLATTDGKTKRRK